MLYKTKTIILSIFLIVSVGVNGLSAATVFNPNQTLDPGASDPTCTLTTCYIQASTTSISTGTIVNSTLRWNGTNWVENTGFLTNSGNSTSTNSTTTNSWVSNILSALTAIFTNLTSTNATITSATTTNFSTTLLTSSATSTFNGTVILNAAVQDSFGATGTANQVLISTGTSTKWATAPSSLPTGTATNTTLRWNGSAWVENTSFLADATGNATWTNSTSTQIFSTNASITNSTTTNLFAVLLNAITGYITNLYSTNATITNATTSNFATTNLTATGTFALATGTIASTSIGIINSLGTSTFNGKVILNSAVQDSYGATGTANQILISTGTSTRWSTLSTGAIASGTATSSTLRWDGSNWVENTGFQTNGGNATWTNSTSTQIFSTNASITNSTTTNLFAVLLNAITGYITNLYSTNATITNATSSNIAVNNLIATSTLGVGTTTNIYGEALTTGVTLNNALVLASSTNLSTSTFALYNNNGTLYWNGSALGGGSASGVAGAIQLSNGSGGFVSTTTLNYATSTNILTFGPLSSIVRIFSSTTDAVSNNLFFGASAGNTGSTNTGTNNTGVGGSALSLNTTGSNNTSVGLNGLKNNTTGNYNSSYGVFSLENNTTGIQNTGLGIYTLYLNTTGSYNTAVGADVLEDMVSGDSNNAFGKGALGHMATGSNNVAIGNSAGISLLQGDGNILIGNSTAISSAKNNFLNIGNTLFATNISTTTPAGMGINASTSIYGGDMTAGLTLGKNIVSGTDIANVLQIYAATGTANVSTTTYALYNINGQLYWNGAAVGGSATMPFSGLTAATGTNTLDNTNLAQVWNWSTATSATALTLKASSLNGGTLLKLDSGITGMGNASTLLNIDTSVATTGTALSITNNGSITSNLVNIQGGGTGNVLALTSSGNTAASTGNMLSIAITGSSNLEQGLKITNAGQGLSMNISGAVAFGGTSYDPASLYANNASVGNATYIYVNSTVAPFNGITGISDLLGTAVAHKSGRLVYLINGSTTAAFTLYNESASSTAANRILTGTGADMTVDSNATVQLIYDSFSSRWRVVGGSGGASTAVQTITASTTLTSWNQTVYVNTSAGNITLTLPTAVGYAGKNITIKKTTNDTNAVSIVPASGQYIDNASTTVSLTSYLSAATVQSDGANPKLVSDIGAVGAEYGQNSGITSGQSTNSSTYSDITGSSFTIPSAGAWEIISTLSVSNQTSNQSTIIQLTDSLGNPITGGYKNVQNTGSDNNYDQTTSFVVQVVTTGATTYKLQWKATGGTSTIYNNVDGSSNITYKKISGYQPVIGQMVDYAYAEAPSGQNILTTNTVINFASSTQGNITNTSGTFALKAGKTYSLSAVVGVAGNGDYAYYRWYDVTNSTFIGSVGTGGNLASLSGVSRNAEAVYTPNTNVTVQVRVSSTGSGSPVTSNDADDINGGHYASAVKIIQLGSTAMTGVSLSVITNAVANGSLDNTNYTQTWDWSTATSSNAMALSANSLTTGSLLSLTTTSSNLNGTNGLVNIQAANATSSKLFTIGTSTVGNVLSVFANGLVGIGTTSPSATLSLAGNIFASTTATSTFLGGGINLISSSGNVPCYAINGVCLTNNSSYQWATTTNNMIYYSSGNVGIGTSSPYSNAKLTVAIPTDAFTSPTYLAGVDGGGTLNSGVMSLTGNDIAISGNYAYVVYSGSTGTCSSTASATNGCELKIFDISSTTNPVYKGGGDISGTTNSGTTGAAMAFSAIKIYGNYAYIAVLSNSTGNCNSSISSCEIQVWNISDPTAPVYVAGGDADGSSSGAVADPFTAIEVSTDGNYVFTTGGSDVTACSQSAGSAQGCELKVWSSLQQGTLNYVAGYDGQGYSKTGALVANISTLLVNGNFLLVGGSDSNSCGSGASASGCDVDILNILDPLNITFISGVDGPGTATAGVSSTVNALEINGSNLYVGRQGVATACSATNGSRNGCELQVYNIANISSPTFVAGYDMSGSQGSGTVTQTITGIDYSNDYLYVSKAGSATACSNTVGSAIGCEVLIFGASSTPYYAFGLDTSGSVGSGTGGVSGSAMKIFGSYLYLLSSGNATACSGVTGSGVGCELKIFQVGANAVSGGYALSVIGRAVGTSWESFSDRNLKENFFEFATSTLDNVLALKPTKYNFKGDSKVRYGFIAQEVQEVMPELVSSNNGILSMDYMGLIAPTVKAIQELNNKVFAGSTSTAVNIEELTASSTISVDAKLKALGTNMNEVNKLLAGLNDLTATSSTVSTSTITHVTTTLSNTSCSVDSHVGDSFNGGTIKSISISTSTIEINGVVPPPTATCEVVTYSTTTEEKVEMTFVGKMLARITTWLADSANGITNIFAKNLNAEEKICLGKEGSQVCMTKDQLEKLLQNSGVNTPTPQPSPSPTPTPEPQSNLESNGGQENQTPTPTPQPVPELQPEPSQEPTPETNNN